MQEVVITSAPKFDADYILTLLEQVEHGGAYLERKLIGPYIHANLAPHLTGCCVLEIGCGFGMHTRRLLAGGPRCIHAIDLSQEMIEIAEKSAPWGKKARFATMSADELNFPSGKFHHASSMFVVENMPDEICTQAFKEVYRVLKTGGSYVVGGLHPLWLMLVSGGSDEPFSSRFSRYQRSHTVVVEKRDNHTYTRVCRQPEWYTRQALDAGFHLMHDDALCIPDPDDDPDLPQKYHCKKGFPVFRMLTLRK